MQPAFFPVDIQPTSRLQGSVLLLLFEWPHSGASFVSKTPRMASNGNSKCHQKHKRTSIPPGHKDQELTCSKHSQDTKFKMMYKKIK